MKLNVDFLVCETLDRTICQGKLEVGGNGFGKGAVGVTGHQLHERDPVKGAFGTSILSVPQL